MEPYCYPEWKECQGERFIFRLKAVVGCYYSPGMSSLGVVLLLDYYAVTLSHNAVEHCSGMAKKLV